jgi:PAS domain S-box-containing protein
MLGYSQEELMRKTWSELTYPDDLPGEDAQFRRMLGGAVKGRVADQRFVCKGGTLLYASVSAQCMRKKDGTLDCILILVQDITERKRLEREAKRHEGN